MKAIRWTETISRGRLTRGAGRLGAVLLLVLTAVALGGREPLGAQGKKDPRSYVEVTPQTGVLEVGQQMLLRAAVVDPIGFDLVTRKVSWKSSDPTIATVSSQGLVTALTPGDVTITAKSGPAMGAAAISIKGSALPPNTAPTLTITSPADGSAVPEGTSLTFTATAGDTRDGDLSAWIVWTVASADDPLGVQVPLGTGASIMQTLARGSYLVTASVTDSGGLGAVRQIGVTVGCSVIADLRPAQGLKIPQLLQLDATESRDTCGRPLQFYWYCQSDTSTTCPSFMAAANANGNMNPNPQLDLQEFDIIGIGLDVCVAGTAECAPTGPHGGIAGTWAVEFMYQGAPVDLGRH